MSNNSSHDDDDDTVSRATTVRASRGGGAGKWLLGGLFAVLLASGGYWAWKNSATSPTPNTQTAYNDQYSAGVEHAGPLPPTQSVTSEDPAAPDEVAAPAATQPAAAAVPSHRATTHTPPVPEQTIGITPASARGQDQAAPDENIVVTGTRHPVWTRMPSARRLSTLYPVVAQEQGREGEAQLHCTVLQNGALACVRVSETRGFGFAALRVAGILRHASQFADGSDAVGAPVNLRVVFRLPPEDRRSLRG